MEDGKVQWHPAFNSALKIELQDDEQNLYFVEEHLLGSMPMQVDILVVKKENNVHIKKTIGHIFRKHNLFEYKSPDDIFSVNDAYKVCGYACIYKSDESSEEKIDARDVTISIVCNHYPKKMIDHIKERGMEVRCVDKGIYYLIGGIFPMQLIITKELDREEYFWMQRLRADLREKGEFNEVLDVFEKHRFSECYKSVMNVIVHANKENEKEENGMLPILKEIFAEEYAALVKRDGDLEGNYERKVERNAKMDVSYDEKVERNAKMDVSYDEKVERNNKMDEEYKNLVISMIEKMVFLEISVSEMAQRCGLSEERVKEIIEENDLM